MKLKPFIYTFLFAVVAINFSCSLAYQIKEANRRYGIGEYYAAAPLYKRVLSRIPSKDTETRSEIAIKMGNCYRLIGNSVKAEAAYGLAIRYKTDDSTCYLYYADVLRKNDKYKEARSFYYKYLQRDSTNAWALYGLYACEHLKEWKKIPAEYSIKKEDAINSKKEDFCPVVADDDGNTLYFTSSRSVSVKTNAIGGTKPSAITGVRNNDIFVVKKKQNNKWEVPTPLPVEINTAFDEGACCLSADGKTMYFTQCRYLPGQTHGAEIYSSQRSGGDWTVPQIVTLLKDSTVSVAHPAISPDNNYLYFVSDMKGGYGGKDIWRCARQNDSKWGEPENLGNKINTPGDEMFPSFGADGTLYFSSNGLPGFGGLDIFRAKSVKTKDGKEEWMVENMLMPINSSGDDFGITFVGRKNKGYFSSNRQDPKGYDKIYSFDTPVLEFVVEGKVLDNNGDPISDGIVRIVGDNGVNTKIKAKKDGSYRYKLEKGVNYIMQASARGYLNEKGDFSTVGMHKTKSFKNDFKLPSAGKPVKIDNIFYDFGKYTLTKSSEEALNGLVKMMTDNPHVTIELGAHTDMVGSEEFNLELSTKRAQSVVNYLINAGIESNRLTPKGYGKTVPVTVDAPLATEYSFLKEGDVLTDEFILKLTDRQQEIANQINRRTEFRVLRTTYKMY
ncbi:MAG: OmpA family protein [Paludibacteraceae bacterium]|nr:OmpA family protein [Paludibacteraceae bacterium]